MHLRCQHRKDTFVESLRRSVYPGGKTKVLFKFRTRRVAEERKEMAKAKPKGQTSLITIKGEPAWLEWLRRNANHVGALTTIAIDLALRGHVKRDGFEEPLPKRLPG